MSGARTSATLQNSASLMFRRFHHLLRLACKEKQHQLYYLRHLSSTILEKQLRNKRPKRRIRMTSLIHSS